MPKHKKAFTIVELLVVIIVLALLVTLSIVGYSGISFKANVASLQSDLANAKKQLLAYQAQSTSNSFPTAINCTNPSSTEICVKPSSINTTLTYNVNNSANPANFNLTATNGSTKYWVNDSSVISTSPNIVTVGLIINLDAASPDSYSGSGSTWYDISGNGLNATLANSPGFSSSKSGSIILDGINDYLTLPSSSSLTFSGSFTFECWISANSLNSPTDSNHMWSLTSGQTLQYTAGASFVLYDVANRSFGAFSLSTWYHVVITRSSGTLNGYLNNNSMFSFSDSNSFNFSAASIGYRTANPAGYYWNGNISNLKIYDKALSASEVSQNFNASRGRYGI